jgi:hypothetical protein
MAALEYMYPTQAENGTEWVRDMLNVWEKSGKAVLLFPFMGFHPRTLPAEPFWLYMYYRERKTINPNLRGKIFFRIHVVDWNDNGFARDEAHYVDFGGNEKVWFKCDRFQEVRSKDGALLTLKDFVHAHNKCLPSTMRSSIPPVKSQTVIRTIKQYP